MTAVEWYVKQMQLKEQFTQEEFNDITNQALEMEKQQIIESYADGVIETNSRCEYKDSEQYYNKTFKKD